MLGPLHILYRQLTELSQRRKLVAFLFLLPLLLMVLFGAALGDQKVPLLPNSSEPAAIGELKKDRNLVMLFNILGAKARGDSEQGPVRILAVSVRSPTNASSKALLYVLPSHQNTSIVLIDEGSMDYYYVVLDNNSSSVKAAAGPKPLPVGSGFGALPEVDLQPLYSSGTAVKLAQAAVEIFGLGLSIELNPGRRLLDVLFPEIVGLEIGWVGILGAAVNAVEDRVSGARRRILMTPISRASFVLGSAMASFFLVGLQLIVLFATAIFVFNVNIAGNVNYLIPIVSAASLSVIGVGLIISHLSKTPDEAFYLSALVNLPMGVLSSQYIPLAHTWLSSIVTSLFPMTYANQAFTAIMVEGAPFVTVLPQMVSLSIFATALFSLGTVLLMRER